MQFYLPQVWVTSRYNNRSDGQSFGDQNARLGIGLAMCGDNSKDCHLVPNTMNNVDVAENFQRVRKQLSTMYEQHGGWPDIFIYGLGDGHDALQANVLKQMCSEVGSPVPYLVSYISGHHNPDDSPADVIVVPAAFDVMTPHAKIVLVDGIPHRLSKTAVAAAAHDTHHYFTELLGVKNDCAAILIGNPPPACLDTHAAATALGDHLAELAVTFNLNLLLATSARTDPAFLKVVTACLDAQAIGSMLLPWPNTNATVPNIYPGILGLNVVKAVFVTEDSMSMISEVASVHRYSFILRMDWPIHSNNAAHNNRFMAAGHCRASSDLLSGRANLYKPAPLAQHMQTLAAHLHKKRLATHTQSICANHLAL